jgi:hypothetical protein
MTKAALALLALLVAGAGVAIAFALQRSHDAVPGRLRECAEKRGAVAVTARESLGVARPDVLAGRPPKSLRSRRIGDDRAVLLTAAGYAVLVVRTPHNPPLGPDPLLAVYRDPSRWALVAVERDPVRGALADCYRR